MYYICEELITTKQKKEYKIFLEQSGLQYEESDIQLGVYNGSQLIGGVSLDKNCIKLLRVSCNYEGIGISNILISNIIKIAYEKGIEHLFVYTKVEHEEKFNKQGFYTIYKTDSVLFLENKSNGIYNYIKELEKFKSNEKNSCSLVMNLNPLTKGHEYLIKKASECNDYVHVIIVKEDKSLFPYEVRLNILNQVCKKYNNVKVHSGSDYIISNATFPTYFIKSKENITPIYAELDANIFGSYIGKALNINRRYIGTEPFSKTTNLYNEILKSVLPKYGIEVIECERYTIDNEVVSASKVRNYIKEGNLDKAYNLLPIESINFLKTKEGKEIIEKIKISDSRH